MLQGSITLSILLVVLQPELIQHLSPSYVATFGGCDEPRDRPSPLSVPLPHQATCHASRHGAATADCHASTLAVSTAPTGGSRGPNLRMQSSVFALAVEAHVCPGNVSLDSLSRQRRTDLRDVPARLESSASTRELSWSRIQARLTKYTALYRTRSSGNADDHAQAAAVSGDRVLGDHETLEEFEEAGGSVFRFNLEEVESPLAIATVLILLLLARLGFTESGLLNIVPESVLTIGIGMCIGLVLEYGLGRGDVLDFNETSFFIFLLPLIILNDGFHADTQQFLKNLGSILTFAFANTLFNAIAIGYTMYGVGQSLGIDFPVTEALVFGALIAAVDPVAVLAVFEKVHVNETLFVLVFGESILNDGISIVLYRVFVVFAYDSSATGTLPDAGEVIGLLIADTAVVFFGGIIIGVIVGLCASTVNLMTRRMPVLAPIVIASFGYLAYLLSEMCHVSGIISLLVCGMTMQTYAAPNLSAEANVATQSVLRIGADVAETYIFVLLGVQVVSSMSAGWHTGFVLSAVVIMFLYRCVGIFFLSYLLNRTRNDVIRMTEQFIMAYGGLRGAIAFALAFILLDNKVLCTSERAGGDDVPFVVFKSRDLILTTTMTTVLITVVFNGSTIKPLLQVLKVRLEDKPVHPTDGCRFFLRVIGTTTEHTRHFVYELIGMNVRRFPAFFFDLVDLIDDRLKDFFLGQNKLSAMPLLDVLEDDVDQMAKQYIAKVRRAFEEIHAHPELDDSTRAKHMTDAAKDVLNKVAKEFDTRLNRAFEGGHMHHHATASQEAVRERRRRQRQRKDQPNIQSHALDAMERRDLQADFNRRRHKHRFLQMPRSAAHRRLNRLKVPRQTRMRRSQTLQPAMLPMHAMGRRRTLSAPQMKETSASAPEIIIDSSNEDAAPVSVSQTGQSDAGSSELSIALTQSDPSLLDVSSTNSGQQTFGDVEKHAASQPASLHRFPVTKSAVEDDKDMEPSRDSSTDSNDPSPKSEPADRRVSGKDELARADDSSSEEEHSNTDTQQPGDRKETTL